ncbi:MAG: hypothetical protein F6K10_13940 [Moorea sp. SIO2B7]|nr:hypothetical protein [Moorena sp. SIO2B7]
MNTSTNSPFTSLCLKLVGIIIIISSLLDYIILAIPFKPLEQTWQIAFTTQIVDRGIIPMVGMAFLLVGYWMESNVGGGSGGQGSVVKLPVFLLASILGLIFLLLVPLHLNNLRSASSDILAKIEQGAGQAETRLQSQFDQLNQISQDPQALNQLQKNLKEIDQALASGKFRGQQINPRQRQQLQQNKQQIQQFQQLAKDPKTLEARLNELQTKLREQKQEREKRAKTEAFKQGVRTGLSSLMLAGGYSAIGWLGLIGMGGSSGSKPSRTRPSRR